MKSLRRVTNHFSLARQLWSLLLCRDGGGDHNFSKISIQICLRYLFLQLDLDCLIAIRTCPTQSWVNPDERVMYILNYALQHCALEREKNG